MKVYYKGDDISEYIVGYDDDAETIPTNLDNVAEIIVSLWVSRYDIKKFSKTIRAGYTQLIRVSSTVYKMVLEGSVTSLMHAGTIRINTMIITTDADMSDNRLNETDEQILGILKESINSTEL